FTVVAPGVARAFQPGQFVAVTVGGPDTSMLLRRSFALYGVKPGTEFAGTVQFVVAPHGRGTEWLLALGSDLTMILGAASADRLFGQLAAKPLVGGVTITTDDGSAGQRGR